MSVLTAPRKVTRLDDLGFVGRGKSRHRPRNDASLYGGDYPFFQTGDVKAANLYLTEFTQTYSEAGLAQSKMWEPGTLCITIAANIAETAVLGIPGCFPDSVVGFVANPEKADVRFIKYYIDTIKLRMQNISHGATQDNLSLDKLLTFDFAVPDLHTQRRIAGILSAYDDLIENNLRRIKILEEMAQSLYREWFVHFRFPGHDGSSPSGRGRGEGAKPIPLVDSPLGPIPEGWEVKKMPEAVEVRPKVPVPKDEEIPFVPMGSLSENSMLIGETETRTKASGARFQNGDTLFARITPCLENGKTGFVQFLPDDETVCCGSTEFIVLRSRTVCPEYVYLMARSDPFRDNAIKSMSGATGRQRVQEECFEQFFLAQPPADLLERFQLITSPQFQLIHSLHRRNQILRQARDLLLPKLLTEESPFEWPRSR